MIDELNKEMMDIFPGIPLDIINQVGFLLLSTLEGSPYTIIKMVNKETKEERYALSFSVLKKGVEKEDGIKMLMRVACFIPSDKEVEDWIPTGDGNTPVTREDLDEYHLINSEIKGGVN